MPKFIADFHIHSKYSRAVSKEMIPEELDAWADDKGILVMGTGDFTHPAWFKELQEKLEPAEPGLYRLKKPYKRKTIKDTFADTRFILTAEISSIYSRGGKGRRVHNLVFAPSLETVEKINTQLSWVGNLRSDGRPILGLDSQELVKLVMGVDPEAAVVPAHAWTPWFSVFGSMSGFDSLEECFGEYTKHIFAIETGLSSDPPMNWRLSKLDHIALISNSDSHSLERIGREANIFNTELSYAGIIQALRENDPRSFLSTIEFFPEEGRYHYDGHRLCNVSWKPSETKAHKKICAVCGKSVTVGVLSRVEELADRPEGYQDPKRVPFKNLIQLDEIIGDALGFGSKTKSVRQEYEVLIKSFGSELNVLLETGIDELARVVRPEIARGVELVRSGKVSIQPGYDGEYGRIKIFNEETRVSPVKQKTLF